MLGSILKKMLQPGGREEPEQQDMAEMPRYVVGPDVVLPARATEHFKHYGGKKVLALLSGSQSDGLSGGTSVQSQLFKERGYDFTVIDLRQDGWMERLAALLRTPEEILCAISPMALLANLREPVHGGLRNVWTAAGVPFLSTFGDHPAYFFERHKALGPGHVSLYCFDEHIEAARAWLDPLPTMVKVTQAAWHPVDRSTVDFKAKAAGKVCFFKNGNDPGALLSFWRTLPVPIAGWMQELAHGIDPFQLGRSGRPLHEVVREYVAGRGYVIDERPWIQLFMVAQLDDYARRLKSTLIAESLLDLPVQVYGSFWGHVDFTGRRATQLPGRSYFDTRELVDQSLGVLDMSPNTQSAPHERFLSAIARHTLCLTNEQKYYEENYDLASQMLFKFDPESIRERVAGVLARPDEAVELGAAIAVQGRKIHNDEAAMDAMIEQASLARFSMAPLSFPGQQNFVVWPR